VSDKVTRSRWSIEPADSVNGKKPPRRRRLRLRFGKGDLLPHTYTFALNQRTLVRPKLRALHFLNPDFLVFVIIMSRHPNVGSGF
jgi:hypothetical protein